MGSDRFVNPPPFRIGLPCAPPGCEVPVLRQSRDAGGLCMQKSERVKVRTVKKNGPGEICYQIVTLFRFHGAGRAR